MRLFVIRPKRVRHALLKSLLLALTVGLAWALPTSPALAAGAQPSVFVNEIHYDNIGEDQDEGIEVAGPAGTDLSSYSIELYNGYDQKRYATIPLAGSLRDQENGFGTKFFPIPGLQNGAPDGIALLGPEAVEQTLGYEGTFTAIDGTAAGLVFADIKQFEAPSTRVGQSLQLQGSGTRPEDFSWQGPIVATPDEVNADQHFVEITAAPVNTSAPTISGSGYVGEAQSCNAGSWDNSPTVYSYEWTLDGWLPAGFSENLIVEGWSSGDTLTCTVTASNAAGSTSATSAAVEVVAEETAEETEQAEEPEEEQAEEPEEETEEPEEPEEEAETIAAPLSTSLPAILGSATIGEALSCSNGSWEGGPSSVTYQWSQDGSSVAGATGATYTPQRANAGHTLTCTVTASNSGGSASATSLGVEVVEMMAGPVELPLLTAPATPAAPSGRGSDGVGGSVDRGGSVELGGTAVAMPRAQIEELLRQQLAAARPRAGRLLRYGVLSMYFGIPEPATLVVRWYERGQSAKGGATAKRVLVASGRGRFRSSGGALIEMKLTRSGRELLKHTSHTSLTASATLTPTQEPEISASRTLSVGRR